MTPAIEPTPYLLALETSGDVCGIALLYGESVVVEHQFVHKMHLSERLMEITDFVLQSAGITLKEVSAYAVGMGPGSFTGTRMGVVTIKVWADLFQKPLYGIDSLQALASEFCGLQNTLVLPVLPCRTDVVYTAPYPVDTLPPVPLSPIEAYSLDVVAGVVPQDDTRSILLCGEGVKRYGDRLTTLLQESGKTVSIVDTHFPRVGVIGKLAMVRYRQGDGGDDAVSLVPLYVAPPPITAPKRSFAVVTEA